jgi:hypothetical protein
MQLNFKVNHSLTYKEVTLMIGFNILNKRHPITREGVSSYLESLLSLGGFNLVSSRCKEVYQDKRFNQIKEESLSICRKYFPELFEDKDVSLSCSFIKSGE